MQVKKVISEKQRLLEKNQNDVLDVFSKYFLHMLSIFLQGFDP